jgi:hypothetical protein
MHKTAAAAIELEAWDDTKENDDLNDLIPSVTTHSCALYLQK